MLNWGVDDDIFNKLPNCHMNAQTQYLPWFHRWELSSSLYTEMIQVGVTDAGNTWLHT